MDERHLLLLGLLMAQRQHGYSINEFIERNLGRVSGMKRATAYALLEKLERDGLVSMETVETVGNYPPRKVYAITEAGRETFFAPMQQLLVDPEPSSSLRLAPGDGAAVAYDTTRSVVKGILNPAALLVLFTGIFMLMQLGLVGQSKPFWLTFMEQFGGLVALISAGLLTWQLRRFDTAASAEERSRRWRALNRTIAWIAAGIAVTIFVVALRL